MREIKYSEPAIVFRQGEITKELYVVQQGSVAIYRNYGSENERLLAQLDKGKSFAETAIVSDRPRSVTAVAAAGTVLRVYTNEQFGELQQAYPDMALKIITELSERLRRTTDRFMEACRTLAETMNDAEPQKNKGLWARIKKFAAMYDDACKESYDRNPSNDAAKAMSAYNSYGTTANKR